MTQILLLAGMACFALIGAFSFARSMRTVSQPSDTPAEALMFLVLCELLAATCGTLSLLPMTR